MPKDFFDLHDAMLKIKTVKDFERFLYQMSHSFDKHPDEWEHMYVSSFLNAAGRVTRLKREEVISYEKNKAIDPESLRFIANILLSAGSYE